MGVLKIIFFSMMTLALEHTHNLPRPWAGRHAEYNKLDPEMISLGEKLFFDKTLSRNNKYSCASCHVPESAFTINQEKARGWNGVLTEYNVPVLFNRIDSKLQFWDGRVKSLREQIFHPILNKDEMGMDEQTLLNKLNASSEYAKIRPNKFSRETVERALESFILSLVSGDSRYDLYVAGDSTALSPEEIEGKNLFFNTYKCARCHAGPNFTTEKLSLRCGSTSNKYSTLYKVPTLRNLRSSWPYLHNGHLHSLKEVMDFYDQPNNENGFTIPKRDKQKLILFLNTLNAPIKSYYPSSQSK